MTPSSPDSTGELPAKRRRSEIEVQSPRLRTRQEACRECRLRKVRCDKKRPKCDMCRVRDLGCEYTRAATLPKPNQLDEVTSAILAGLDRLHEDVQGIKESLGADRISSSHGSRESHGAHGASLRSDDPAGLSPATTGFLEKPPEATESSRDFIRILAQRASADAVLEWDIFQKNYPQNALIAVLFGQERSSRESVASHSPTNSVSGAFDQEIIPSLIDRFLQNVHTKNPILDVESLIRHGRHCADYGVGWDGWSCLVLLVCAVASVARPFEGPFEDNPAGKRSSASPTVRHTPLSSAQIHAKELKQGNSFFTLASRRLGLLEYSLLGAQCYFFAGVYLMYVLRPIQSWHHFHHASVFCHFYLRMNHGLSDGLVPVNYAAISQNLSASEQKARRLEQSLYWSCFKSECEFRVELPLPQSEISAGEYPNLFPSPPSPIAAPVTPQHEEVPLPIILESDKEELELHRHASRLCNEEESWYYYLTEIALRRIGNRIINAFFQHDRSSWLNIKPFLRMAQEFEVQVLSWSANLPPVMKHYENSSLIRAPYTNPHAERAGSHVSRELSWAIDNRLLEMQTWLYQPFLYYLIHVGIPFTPHTPGSHLDASPSAVPTVFDGSTEAHTSVSGGGGLAKGVLFTNTPSAVPPPSAPLNAQDNAVLSSLTSSGIASCLKTIDARATAHRHHGLWFDLRSIMCASLVLLAVVRSGNAAWIPGGVEELWGDAPPPTDSGPLLSVPIGGKIQKVLTEFDFWSDEAPDLLRNKRVLEALVRDVRGY